jgi:hypothetical protein
MRRRLHNRATGDLPFGARVTHPTDARLERHNPTFGFFFAASHSIV